MDLPSVKDFFKTNSKKIDTITTFCADHFDEIDQNIHTKEQMIKIKSNRENLKTHL